MGLYLPLQRLVVATPHAAASRPPQCVQHHPTALGAVARQKQAQQRQEALLGDGGLVLRRGAKIGVAVAAEEVQERADLVLGEAGGETVLLAGKREKRQNLKAVQFRHAPEPVLVAVEEAEHAAEDAAEGVGEGLRGAVEERSDGEGNHALRGVEDVADVLTRGGAALHHAVHAL